MSRKGSMKYGGDTYSYQGYKSQHSITPSMNLNKKNHTENKTTGKSTKNLLDSNKGPQSDMYELDDFSKAIDNITAAPDASKNISKERDRDVNPLDRKDKTPTTVPNK